jgi:ankyrin repeat protein
MPDQSATHASLLPSRRLPEKPSLDQLRKQAKDLLADFRESKPDAIAEVRRYERNAPAAEFALNDAQRILARAYGFASWPKLKAFVDGANAARFLEAVRAKDLPHVRALMASRPELVNMGTDALGEQRAIHLAVINRDAPMTRFLMEADADARAGVYPFRDATSALALAREREFHDIVAIIEEEETHRREELSCTNATVTPEQDQISADIARGDRDEALRLLEADPSQIQACDRNGRTPLHIAAQACDATLVAWLLDRRANPRKLDPNDLTPIDLAALAGDTYSFPPVADALLRHGSDLTIRAAVALGDEPRVREKITGDPSLLQQIDVFRGGLVTLALRHRQLEIAKLLLDLGADPNERTLLTDNEEPQESWGMPLWHAAYVNDYEAAKLLLDRGADPNANVYASGWPLGHAMDHPDGRLRKLLLDRGAVATPYMLAARGYIAEARRRLEAQPGDEELANEIAWSAADHGDPEILALALPYLAKWARSDSRWNWILFQPIRAAGNDQATNDKFLKCMALILKQNVDPDVASFGRTTLHYAASGHGSASSEVRAQFAAMLLDHGADFTLRDDLLRSTPLGWAARWGHLEVVKLLLDRGAPAHEPDAEPWAQPLAWARRMNHPKIVALLERHAANRDSDGDTCVSWKPTATDDPPFISIVYRIVEKIVASHDPQELFVTAIDNWFDHKWLGFPHGLSRLLRQSDDSSKKSRSRRLTVPSFTAGRILRQSYFRRDDKTRSLVRHAKHVALHKTQKHPGENRQKILKISESGLFLWYSSNTKKNDRASVMVYSVKAGAIEAWYASFSKGSGWKLDSVKGIDREALEGLATDSKV